MEEWGERSLDLLFVNFCGVNIPPKTHFKLPIWSQLAHKFPENLTVGSGETVQTSSSTTLDEINTMHYFNPEILGCCISKIPFSPKMLQFYNADIEWFFKLSGNTQNLINSTHLPHKFISIPIKAAFGPDSELSSHLSKQLWSGGLWTRSCSETIMA